MIPSLRSIATLLLPLGARRSLSRLALRGTRWPLPKAVRFGSLRRLTPISADWGFDRGLPIDRYYIERFLEDRSASIRGRVLEIDSNVYTVRFGGSRVTQSDVLHIAERKPGVTFVGDLAAAPPLPPDAFDCVILTQTLQFVYDIGAAIDTLHKILRPGGVALVTVPGISKVSADANGAWGHCWSLTTRSALRLFEDRFGSGSVEVTRHGNVLAAMAFLHGLASEELSPRELDAVDPDFEVLLTIVATKRGGAH